MQSIRIIRTPGGFWTGRSDFAASPRAFTGLFVPGQVAAVRVPGFSAVDQASEPILALPSTALQNPDKGRSSYHGHVKESTVLENDFAQALYEFVAARSGAAGRKGLGKRIEDQHSEWTLKDVNDVSWSR